MTLPVLRSANIGGVAVSTDLYGIRFSFWSTTNDNLHLLAHPACLNASIISFMFGIVVVTERHGN